MTELDAELGPIALEVIEEYGKSVAYSVPGTSTYDTDTGRNVIAGEVTFDLKVAPPEDYDGVTVARSGGMILAGDKKLTAPAIPFTDRGIKPASPHTVSFDGVTYSVEGVKTIMSGELAYLYVIQVRE